MRGQVNNHNILLDVVFVFPDRPNVLMAMVVDTGYVGTLTLPTQAIKSMALPFLRRMPAKLADGSSISTGVHLATVLWHGAEQRIEILALDDRPLLGMLMLEGSQMTVQFEESGRMDLEELD